MGVVGRVESVWRYPVKSMRGEKLDSAFVGFAGVYGDRLYAFRNSAADIGFPYLTARECARLRGALVKKAGVLMGEGT